MPGLSGQMPPPLPPILVVAETCPSFFSPCSQLCLISPLPERPAGWPSGRPRWRSNCASQLHCAATWTYMWCFACRQTWSTHHLLRSTGPQHSTTPSTRYATWLGTMSRPGRRRCGVIRHAQGVGQGSVCNFGLGLQLERIIKDRRWEAAGQNSVQPCKLRNQVPAHPICLAASRDGFADLSSFLMSILCSRRRTP